MLTLPLGCLHKDLLNENFNFISNKIDKQTSNKFFLIYYSDILIIIIKKDVLIQVHRHIHIHIHILSNRKT